LVADNVKCVAAIVNFNPQATLDLAQMTIKLAAQIRQSFIIGWFEDKTVGLCLVTQNVSLLTRIEQRHWIAQPAYQAEPLRRATS